MRPEEFGRRLGLGIRVAGRIATDRAQAAANSPNPVAGAAGLVNEAQALHGQARAAVRQAAVETGGKAARVAGRGILGFLRPFTRVGHILWLEVTGVFFGLFTLWFGVDLGRVGDVWMRAGWVSGPLHERILMDAGLGLVFAYLAVSSFWRAGRR